MFPALFSGFLAFGQTDRVAYAITDTIKRVQLEFLRKIDLKTGAYSDVVLNGSDAASMAYDDATKKQLTEP
jgi:hypothetical protein